MIRSHKRMKEGNVSPVIHAAATAYGFVMAEQLKSLDYGKRRIAFAEKADLEVLDDVLSIIDAIMF